MKKHLFSVATLTLVIMMAAFTGCNKVKPEDNTPAPEGLYLGIVGFNSDLYTMPLGLLNQTTKHNFQEFVDGLTTKDGTVLYHAVNSGITSLTTAKVPENLINVSIVTFTDGLDQGSYVLSEQYNSGSEYLAAVNSKIMNNLVGGQNIAAYSIGVRGSDVSNIEAFRENLNKLSSSPSNVYEVSDMNEASEMFAQIAQQLYNQSTFYNVTLKLPAQEPNSLIRFTFDNVTDAAESQCYIEGTYIRVNGKGRLTNLKYIGLDSMSGETVTASSEGIFDVFPFKNLTDLQGCQIDATEIWEKNSEFNPDNNTEIVDEYKSAMIMLVLDCSSSLGSDFTTMKTTANAFIETLSGNYNGRR